MSIRAKSLATSALIASCTAVITASAGNLSFLANSPVAYFNSDDMELMRQNATKVLEAPDPNAKQTWSNAKTGASGMAQVRGQFTASNGTPCKRLRIVNKVSGLESDATYTVCKSADQDWIFNADAMPAR
jgi:17 kDa common-antigen outer membrane protein